MNKIDTFEVKFTVRGSDPMCDYVEDVYVYRVPLVEGENPINAFMDYVRGKSEEIEREANSVNLTGGVPPKIIV